MYVLMCATDVRAKECETLCIRDPYSSPLAQILDSKTLEDLVKDISNVPEVFEVFNAACLSCFGCDMNQISALFAMVHYFCLLILYRKSLFHAFYGHSTWPDCC